VRAWEVYAATGKALSELQAAGEPALAPDSWTAVALEPSRVALYARCDARLAAMAAAGALEEVAALTAHNLDPNLPAMKAVGVREFGAHLAGETTLAGRARRRAAGNPPLRQAPADLDARQMMEWPRITAFDARDQWRQFIALTRS